MDDPAIDEVRLGKRDAGGLEMCFRAGDQEKPYYSLFCNNMPSGYCNDDYYKGIVLSREGVYESYISIAKEAEKRGNHEMSRKFYQYAEEYLRKNE